VIRQLATVAVAAVFPPGRPASMPQVVELQTEALNLPQNFHGTEPLKEILWSTLNYDRKNQRSTRRGWPEATAAALIDDPTLLAAGGAHGAKERHEGL
jgi:hypothetical protein